MNRYVKTSIASLFAISMLAGGAYASGKDKGPNPADPTQVDKAVTGSISNDSMLNSDAVGAWKDGMVNVITVSSLNDVDPNKAVLQDRMNSNPSDVAALQAAIQNNEALKAKLESQNVQIKNIVAAIKAPDGTVTFYVQ